MRISKKDFQALLEGKTRPTTITDIVFFLFGGLGCFVLTYSIMSNIHFWHDRFGNTGYLAMVFSSNVGGIIAFLFYKRIFYNVKKKYILLALPTVNWIINLILVLDGEYIALDSPWKMLINVVANFTFGASIFVMRYTYASIVFKRGSTEIAFFNSGMPAAGIFTVGIGILQLNYIDPSDIFSIAILNIGFQLPCLGWIFMITLLFFRQEENFKEVKKQSIALHLLPPSVPKSAPTLLETLKLIYPMMYSTLFAWAISLMILPNMIWAMGHGWENQKILACLIVLLVYILFDFAGRISYVRFVLRSTMACHYISLIRVIFIAIPLYAYASDSNAWLRDKWWLTMAYAAVHGFISGYISSSQMHIISTRVAKRHKDNAAYLATLATLCGQLYGSICNLLALKLEL